MLNEAIIKLYTNGVLEQLTINTTPETVLTELTKSGIKYTWETVKEQFINNEIGIIEVRLYLPSHILYGRHVYKMADIENAHLHAISNAIKTIVSQKADVEEPLPFVPETPAPVTQQPAPLSQEEILNMIQQQDTKITTAEQFEKDTRGEIPFDDIEMDLNELDNLISGKAASKVYGTEQSQTTPQQQPVSHGFTQNQISAINEFKQRMNITNDAMLGNYINSWDNKLSKKEDLNPSNIDSFIEWTNSVGKAPC